MNAKNSPSSHSPLLLRLSLVLIGGMVALIIAGCGQSLDKVTGLPGQAPASSAIFRTGNSSPFAQAWPGSLPAPGEELWVISRTRSISNPSGDPALGCGSMVVEVENRRLPMPLQHTDVKAHILGYIASVKVLQQFQNPYDHKIEAAYVFPLPENAAVNEFIVTIGERHIRGIIREREEAEKIYHEAKRQGYVASLLTQERPNVFTQSVANIEPGKEIDVAIQYFHTLAYADGWYEFVFPMVVGPRFNPPDWTNGVGDVSRERSGASGQKTEVAYLHSGERSGHDISLAVDIHAGVEIEETLCRSHRIVLTKPSFDHAAITLDATDSIPNQDFVLRYRVAGDRIKSGLVAQRDERGGFFTLMLYPPAELRTLARQPLELVFALDCSGSMSGRPIAQAKAAIERAFHRLQPGDSFQLINFSEKSSQLGPRPLEASSENIRRGLDYLRALSGDGSTMMIEGVKAALDFPHDPQRLRFVAFLTDGFIGNEVEILRAVHHHIGASRIFSFGVGSSPNRYLLDGMAKAGRGAVAYLALDDSASPVMDAFFDRVSHPALTDVSVDWSGAEVSELYPRRVPDLFVGRPVILTGRFDGELPNSIRLVGRTGLVETPIPTARSEGGAPATSAALPSVWARMKIADLADQGLVEGAGDSSGEIKQLALDFNLLSAFTAFVAVDSATRTVGGRATRTPVAVPVPEVVSRETTVKE